MRRRCGRCVPTDARRAAFRRGVYLLPSMFTMANMFCGYACIVYAMRGEFATAAPFIGFAIVLDMLDGRVARMTGTTSDFGVEFDSLADVISFGVAPAILSFPWGLQPLGRARAGRPAFSSWPRPRCGWRASTSRRGSQDKRYFVGMPSPAAAARPGGDGVRVSRRVSGATSTRVPVLAMVIVPALLMVSTIRFRSFKTFDLQSRRSYRCSSCSPSGWRCSRAARVCCVVLAYTLSGLGVHRSAR